MNDHDKLFIKVAVIGAIIAIGKMLAGQEVLSLRKVIGRAILGSAASIASFAILINSPDLPALAVVGLSSVLGIVGHSAIEYLAIKFFSNKADKCKKSD